MSRRKGGVFLPLDVNFLDDTKILRAGEKASWLYLAMCLACKRQQLDGTLEDIQIDRLHVAGWRVRLAQLVEVGLVEDFGGGLYAISSWFDHNDPVHVVQERRRADSERKKGTRPVGIRSESVPVPKVREGNRREKEGKRPPHGPCPGCSDCPALHVVSLP